MFTCVLAGVVWIAGTIIVAAVQVVSATTVVNLRQALFGAKAVIGTPHFHQLFGILLVDLLALALYVGAMFSTDNRALIILDAGHLQRLQDHVHSAGHLAHLIGILDAKDEAAVL